MSSELVVLLGGVVAGSLSQSRTGQVTFEYTPDYADDENSTPLSVSMPLIQRVHRGPVLDNWLTNLLPDNVQVLQRWATQFHVSASSPFALLKYVGRDVAGAAQFVLDTELEQLGDGGVNWLSEEEVEGRIAELESNPAAWTPEHESGQFSLPGAQPKMALRHEDGRWGEPWGFEPTNRIVKPPMAGFRHQELNEHLSLATARKAGLRVARSEVLTFRSRQVISVVRYDRYRDEDGPLQRVHQEDLCQAMGLPPSKKYQSGGGPDAVEIIELLVRLLGPVAAASRIERFVQALAFAWATGAPDAHAKNYSLLLSGTQIELAPLYDLNSALPYLVSDKAPARRGQLSAATAGMAMSINGRRRFGEIERRDWEALAARAGLADDYVTEVVGNLVASVEEAVERAVSQELATDRLTLDQRRFASKFQAAVVRQVKQCRVVMEGRPAPVRRKRKAPRQRS